MKSLVLTGSDLRIEDVYHVAHKQAGEIELSISPDSMKKMEASREFVLEIAKGHKAVYSINTGFGALSSQKISTDQLDQLQYNLIRSHCTGVGTPFDRVVTRAIMLLRANCLISGFSGINPEIVELLLDFLYHDIIPVVPSKGSVGASGDLAPLSHVAIALIGEGQVIYQGKQVKADFAINDIGKKPAKLGPKDGLALINGTAVMTALGSLAVHEATELVKTCDISAALTLEALRGTSSAYHELIQKAKPHEGQISSALNLRRLLSESAIASSHVDCNKVQDPYSLRCVPQVHGACRQTLKHAGEVIQTELNSITDNPLIFVDTKEVVSGGNFHGEAIALVMDYLTMGLSELCNISERRVEKMMNPSFSGLPAFLVENPGLNSGLMIAQVTMAALASENKYLCHPASVDSIPTSTDKEDHVSMGVTSGRKLFEVLDNLRFCLAIELLCSTQALEFLKPLTPSPALTAVYNLVRKHIEPIKEDRYLQTDISKLKELVETFQINGACEKVSGGLI